MLSKFYSPGTHSFFLFFFLFLVYLKKIKPTTIISGHLPTRLITCTDYCIQQKKINRLPALVDNPPMWPHFVRVIVQHHVDLLKESWVSV